MTIKKKRVLIPKWASAFIASMLLTLGVAAFSADQASAITTYYKVNTTRACQQQYGGGVFGSSYYRWSPDGLYCYGLSFPLGISWIGTLDKGRIYWYCKATYGSRADAVVRPGWRLPTSAWWCKVT